MAVAELARIISAVNTILEEVSRTVGLSKRGALALGVIAIEPEIIDGKPVMTNQGLRNRLVKHKISTELSNKKDASAAKTELLEHRCIAVEGSVSIFSITPEGHRKVEALYEAMERAIDETGLPLKERDLLRKLVGLSQSEAEERKEGLGKKKTEGPRPEEQERPENRLTRKPSMPG